MITTLLFGGITHHLINYDFNYCNLINNVGTIQNNYAGVLLGSKTFQIGLLKGRDSACGNISGPIMYYNIYEEFGVIAGYYNTNTKRFYERGIPPITFNGYTPIIGIDYKYKLYENKGTLISIDNIISMGIVTHALTISF